MEKCNLSNAEITRYTRQLIIPGFGPTSQEALRNARVLIVGCGGLGCPAAIYLTGAGVGTLGVIDDDVVDVSNLHRQVLHKENRIGSAKVLSLAHECERLNSSIKINAYHLQLNSTNALQIVKRYDIVLDCTDNVATRYLINDACVLSKLPLVSGSALKFEGQLIVYNFKGGPCYRCVFPRPVPAHLVTNCSDGGVIGAVPGTIGTLQALETIKIITNDESSYSGTLLLFDGECGDFMTLKLQQRNPKCEVCSDSPSIHELIDYALFCGSKPNDKDQKVNIVAVKDRITVQEYKKMVEDDAPHILIDVRPKHEFIICRLKNSLNIPLKDLSMEKLKSINWDQSKQSVVTLRPLSSMKKVTQFVDTDKQSENGSRETATVFLCRRGNDSQLAVKKIQEQVEDTSVVIKDIIGGLHQWAHCIDKSFPVY